MYYVWCAMFDVWCSMYEVSCIMYDQYFTDLPAAMYVSDLQPYAIPLEITLVL